MRSRYREGGVAFSTTVLLAIDLIIAISEEPLNGVSQLVQCPFVVNRRIILLIVKMVKNVDRVSTVVSKVSNHNLTIEIVCRTFLDS
jgi:hypothetical protein